MHPAWRHPSQSANAVHHCHCSFGVATHGFHKHWDDYGVRPTTKHGECSWSSVITLQNTSWLIWPLTKLQRLLLSFYDKDTSWSLAKFLSDWGTNFKSNIVKELCELMGIWNVRTSPYHAQTNRQVEWAHQMFMCIIGKLSRDWKVDWPKHLPELVHAYNSMRLAITAYSLHYLMFGHQWHLPINFYFPMMRGMEKHWCVDCYIAKLCEWLWEAFKETQVQSTSESERQKWYYDRKANAISLETGDLVLAKADAYRGKRQVKDWWEK